MNIPVITQNENDGTYPAVADMASWTTIIDFEAAQ